jgi:hypothetical protein
MLLGGRAPARYVPISLTSRDAFYPPGNVDLRRLDLGFSRRLGEPVVKHGLWLRTNEAVSDAIETAVLAEEAGWDGVFVADSIWEGWADPWTTLAAVAVRTERIRIGTWVTPLPHKTPWWLANTVATLDRLSGGRVILGVGLGAQFEYEMFGGQLDMKALGRKYDEALEVITGLWSGEPFSFEGEFFKIENAKLPVTPVQKPRVPVLMGCWWPNRKPFQRAARYDGIMPNWPAMLGDEGGKAWGPGGVGPQGEERTGTLEEELRDLLSHYFKVADDPGEVFVPVLKRDPDYEDLSKRLGATWLYHMYIRSKVEIRRGPPQ